MFNVGSAVGYLLLDTSNWEKGLKAARTGLNTFGDETATAADKWAAAGTLMGATGKTLTLGVTAPLLGLGAASVKVGNEFEAQMSRVKAISGATQEEFEALNELALELGASTAFSASEVAQGMENLASAGFTTNEIISGMSGLLDLAASSGADLATASEIAASAVRGFGLEASQTGYVADIFAEAAARTNAQVEDMGEAMKYIAPVAKAMGQDITQTAAAIGLMSDAGIKGSQAGTTLRGAFSRLAKPTDKMYEVMEDLGLSFYKAEGEMLPLNEMVKQLEETMGGLTQEQRNQALVTLFGQEALSGMLALMDRGSEELLSLSESFHTAEGSAATMAETMLDNTSGAVEEMLGSLETLGIKVQQVLAPVLTDVIQSLTGLVSWLGSLDEGTMKLLVTITAILTALGPVLIIAGKIATAISAIQTLIAGAGGLSAILTALTGPIGMVIAALAAFATAWATNFGGIRDIVKSGVKFISDNITALGEWLPNFLNSSVAESLFNAGQFIFTSLWNGIKSVWNGIKSWIEEKIKWLTSKLSSLSIAGASVSASPVSNRSSSSGGSYSSGLDYVPRDMNVRVHEGERILTKQENLEGESQKGGDTFNFYSPEALTPVKAAREFKRVKQELALGFK